MSKRDRSSPHEKQNARVSFGIWGEPDVFAPLFRAGQWDRKSGQDDRAADQNRGRNTPHAGEDEPLGCLYKKEKGNPSSVKREICASLLMVSLLGVDFVARAADGEEEIRAVIRGHRISPSEVKVKANIKIKLLVSNEDPMAEEFESFSLDREKAVRPGQTVTIYLPPLKAGSYEFEGGYHPETAKGRIVAE